MAPHKPVAQPANEAPTRRQRLACCVARLAAEVPSFREALRLRLAGQGDDAVLAGGRTWTVHDAALAALPVLVHAELHLRRLAAPQADELSWRLLAVFEDLINLAGDVEGYGRRWDGGKLAAITAPLAAMLAAYERVGDSSPVEPAANGDADPPPRGVPDLAGLAVPKTQDDDDDDDGEDAGRIDATATWNAACAAVRHGADAPEVARALMRAVPDDADWRRLWQTATSCGAAGWQPATAPGTVLRAALVLADDDAWWTGPGDCPVHVSASSVLALVASQRALIEAVGRLIPAAEAHATNADALAEEVAEDPAASADERRERHLHAAATAADIAFALNALEQATGVD